MAKHERRRQGRLWVVPDDEPASPPGDPVHEALNAGEAEESSEVLEHLFAPLIEDHGRSPILDDVTASMISHALRVMVGDVAVAGPAAGVEQAIERRNMEPPDEVAVSHLVDLIADGARAGRPGFSDGLQALAVYGGPLAPAAAAMVEAGLPSSPVGRHAGRARIEAAHLVVHLAGDAFELMLRLHYPDSLSRSSVLIGFETFGGASVADIQTTDESDELLAETRQHPLVASVDEVSVADALNTVKQGLWLFDHTLRAPDDDLDDGADNRWGFMPLRPMIDHLLATHDCSEATVGIPTVELDHHQREALADELTRWVESQEPGLVGVAEAFAPLMVDFTTDRAGDPHRWTASVAVRFLEMASSKIMAEPDELKALPALVRHTVQWAHAHQGWPDELTREALMAIDMVQPLYEAELDLFGSLDGFGLGDEGEEDEAVVHPEPFDEAGIDPDLVERARTIAEMASDRAAELFDDEMISLVRRFAADAARHPDSPFRGRGKLELWASGVVYAVAQVSRIPGGYHHLAMPANQLSRALTGSTASVTAKARQLRRLLDADGPAGEPYRHSASNVTWMLDQIGLGPGGGIGGDAMALLAGLLGDMTVGRDPAFGPGPIPGMGRVTPPKGVGADRTDDACFVLRVSLVGSRPGIWRRVRVPVDATFAQLHHLLQMAVGWYDAHLHEFDIDGYRVGPTHLGSESLDLSIDASEDEIRLGDVLEPGTEATYTYDFGDNWEHRIKVEELQLGGSDLEHGPWALLGGKNAGPPEDCGGVWGYRDLLEARTDRNHPRWEEVQYYFPPGFDPGHFDPTSVNRAVKAVDWNALPELDIW